MSGRGLSSYLRRRSRLDERCAAQQQSSEREFVLTALVLQRDKMVRKAKDIRPLLTRRMDMWEAGQLKELLQEAQRCDRQLATSLTPMNQEQVERTFARLMMEGRVRSAVRLLTDRLGGGVLDPGANVEGAGGPPQRTVLDVLQEKHPPQKEADPRAFAQCDDLPLLEDVDITSSHVEQVARRLFGSAGPSGTDSDQWRSFQVTLWELQLTAKGSRRCLHKATCQPSGAIVRHAGAARTERNRTRQETRHSPYWNRRMQAAS